MSALVTLAPINADPTGFTRGPVDQGVNGSIQSPFLYTKGSAQYYVGDTGIDSITGPDGRIFKSTDGGLTWTRQDVAGEPVDGFGNTFLYDASYFDGTRYIYIYYRSNNTGATRPSMVIFDTNTDTYGAPITDLAQTSVGANPAWVVLVQSDATAFVFFMDAPGVNGLTFLKESGGAWDPTAVIVIGPIGGNSWLIAGAIDGTDKFHLFYADSTIIGPTYALTYIPMSAGLTPGAPVVLKTITASDPFNSGVARVWNNSIVLPFIDPPAPNIAPKVLIGTPLSAPVWTEESVDVGLVAPQFTGNFPILSVDLNGDLVYDWIVWDQGGNTVEEIWRNRRTVSGWGTPVLVYDKLTNQPPLTTFEGLHTLGATQQVSGGWLWGVAMDVDSHTGLCAGWILKEDVVPTTQTLELTKIVAGGPAVPGDFTLTATGGSPESDISGDGHVGPTEVSTGLYELSETAFPDNTFDSQTGTWADNNNTWGGNYEAGAWDCGAAEMPTPTSVIVPANGTVACTITNTFIPTPPPPPPPGPGNGQINAVGCWELLRLDVTLMPSRHLPTRGSVK